MRRRAAARLPGITRSAPGRARARKCVRRQGVSTTGSRCLSRDAALGEAGKEHPAPAVPLGRCHSKAIGPPGCLGRGAPRDPCAGLSEVFGRQMKQRPVPGDLDGQAIPSCAWHSLICAASAEPLHVRCVLAPVGSQVFRGRGDMRLLLHRSSVVLSAQFCRGLQRHSMQFEAQASVLDAGSAAEGHGLMGAQPPGFPACVGPMTPPEGHAERPLPRHPYPTSPTGYDPTLCPSS